MSYTLWLGNSGGGGEGVLEDGGPFFFPRTVAMLPLSSESDGGGLSPPPGAPGAAARRVLLGRPEVYDRVIDSRGRGLGSRGAVGELFLRLRLRALCIDELSRLDEVSRRPKLA
jgi:hypothetical protein